MSDAGLLPDRQTRAALRAQYDEIVTDHPGLIPQVKQADVVQSEQYYLLRVEPGAFGASRDDLYDRLKECGVFARKYFWPICTDYDCYRGMPITSCEPVPVADQVKTTLLCMPFHSGVTAEHLEVIATTIAELSAEASRVRPVA